MATATTKTKSKAPCWRYSRVERLEDLVDRQRQAEAYLRRSRCDASGVEDLAVIDRRLAVVQHRLRGLYAAARSARRAARVMTTAD